MCTTFHRHFWSKLSVICITEQYKVLMSLEHCCVYTSNEQWQVRFIYILLAEMYANDLSGIRLYINFLSIHLCNMTVWQALWYTNCTLKAHIWSLFSKNWTPQTSNVTQEKQNIFCDDIIIFRCMISFQYLYCSDYSSSNDLEARWM